MYIYNYNKNYLVYIDDNTDTSMLWNERNRLTQITYLAYNANSVTPENNQEYKMVIKKLDDTIIDTITGITGNNYTYSQAQEIIDFGELTDKKIELSTVRDGYESFTKWNITINRFKDLIISVNETTGKFEITNPNIDCDVYYTMTTNGNAPLDPTDISTKYIEPFDFQNNFWIKAVAICGDNSSKIFTAKWIILNGTYNIENAIYTKLNIYDKDN